MLLNLDIWHEVINYLDYSEDNDTLKSLAVTSHCLSNLALNALWRNGENVATKVVSVLNSFAPLPNEPFLEYIQDPGSNASDSEDSLTSPGGRVASWVLNKTLPQTAQKRILEYLARIRELAVERDEPPGMSESIWLTLSACLSTREPLLPNLQRLDIQYFTFHHVESLIPLLSPSLKVLSIRSEYPPKVRTIFTILNFVKSSGCSLKHFTYGGCIFRQLPEAAALFKDIQTVQFPLHISPPDSQKTSITLGTFLTLLPSLRSLTCDLAAFPHVMDHEDKLCHISLEEISISSPVNAFCRMFRPNTLFPSLTRVIFSSHDEIPNF